MEFRDLQASLLARPPLLLLSNCLPNRKITGGRVDKGAWDFGGFEAAGICGKGILEVALTCSWCNMVGLEMGGNRVQSEMAASICGAFVKMLARKPFYLILTMILWRAIIIILVILYVRSLIVREIKPKGIWLASGQIRMFHPGLWFWFCLCLSRFRVESLQRERQSRSRVGCVLGLQVVQSPWLLGVSDDQSPQVARRPGLLRVSVYYRPWVVRSLGLFRLSVYEKLLGSQRHQSLGALGI